MIQSSECILERDDATAHTLTPRAEVDCLRTALVANDPADGMTATRVPTQGTLNPSTYPDVDEATALPLRRYHCAIAEVMPPFATALVDDEYWTGVDRTHTISLADDGTMPPIHDSQLPDFMTNYQF